MNVYAERIIMQKTQWKRIVLNNTPAFHQEIKLKATMRHMTMKDYINMAILAQMKRDQQ